MNKRTGVTGGYAGEVRFLNKSKGSRVRVRQRKNEEYWQGACRVAALLAMTEQDLLADHCKRSAASSPGMRPRL